MLHLEQVLKLCPVSCLSHSSICLVLERRVHMTEILLTVPFFLLSNTYGISAFFLCCKSFV